MKNIKKSPLSSLQESNWFKLICGASYQHLSAIRNLTLVYTLAGADCIDLAADKAVIIAAQEGLKIAQNLQEEANKRGYHYHFQPYLMISINDGEDPHFRKAEFNIDQCPSDCHRPCEKICPALAIAFNEVHQGVIDQLCYGCGRCLPVCPSNLIFTRSYVSKPEMIVNWLSELNISAIEIHTQKGHKDNFRELWSKIASHVSNLKILAISCPFEEEVVSYLKDILTIIEPLSSPLIWQTDGRPMSGDIGIGTTHLTIKYAQEVLKSNLSGYIQLAGGTNQYTGLKLKNLNLLSSDDQIKKVSGIAFGSYGRKILTNIFTKLETKNSHNLLENEPELLWQAVEIANNLVKTIKLTD